LSSTFLKLKNDLLVYVKILRWGVVTALFYYFFWFVFLLLSTPKKVS
jgi:hypothetical protein